MLAVVVAICLLISVTGLAAIIRHYRAAKQSIHWRQVTGKLLECEITQKQDDLRNVFNLLVRYSYEIDGEYHESTDIMFYFPHCMSSRSYYEDFENRLTGNNTLAVYVNPLNHRKAVLVPGAESAPIWLLLVAGVMMVVCPISAALALYALFFPR